MMKRRRARRKYKLPPEVPNALSTALEQQLLEDFIRGKHDRPPLADHQLELLNPDSRGYSDFEALLRGEYDAAAQEAEVATGPLPPKPECVWDRQTGHRKLQTTAHNVQRQEQQGGSSSSTAPADAPSTSEAEILDSLELGPPGVPGQPGAQPKSLSQLVPGEFGPRCRRPAPPGMTAKPLQEFGEYSIETTADHRRNAAQKIIDQCKTLSGMISLASANAVSTEQTHSQRRNKLAAAARRIIFDVRSSEMDHVGSRVEMVDITRFQLLKYSHAERQLKESVAKDIKTSVKRLKKTQRDGALDLDRIQRRMHVQGRAANALLQVTTGGHDSEFADRMLGVQLRHRELAAMAALGSYALGRFKLFTNFQRNIGSYKNEAYALREVDAQQKAAPTENKKDDKADRSDAKLELEKQALKMKVMENRLQVLREDEKQATLKAKLARATSPFAQDEGQNNATDRTADAAGEHQGTDATSQSVEDQPQNRFEKIEKNRNKLKSVVQNSAANMANLGRMLEFVENAQENMKQIMHDIGKVERKHQLVLGELQDEVELHSSHHMEIMIQSLEFPWRLLNPEVLPPQKSRGDNTMEQTQSDGTTPADSVEVTDATSPTGKALHAARKTIKAISGLTTSIDAASLDSDGQKHELAIMRKRRNRMLALRDALTQGTSSAAEGTAKAEASLDQLHGEHAEAPTPIEADTDSMNQLRTVATQAKMILSDMKREIADHEAEVDQLDESDEAGKRLLEQFGDSLSMLMNILSQHKPSQSPQALPAEEGEATAKTMERLTVDFANLSRSMPDQQEPAQQTDGAIDGKLPEEAANQLHSDADFQAAPAEDLQALLDQLLAAKNEQQKQVEALRKELDELQGSIAGTNDILQDASTNEPTPQPVLQSEATGTRARQLHNSSDSNEKTGKSLVPKNDSAKQDMQMDHVGAAEGTDSENGIQEGSDGHRTEALLQDQEVPEAELQEATRQGKDLKAQISELEAELETLVSANEGKQQVAGGQHMEGRQGKVNADNGDIEMGLQTEKTADDRRQEGRRQQLGDEAGGEQQTEGPEGGLEVPEAEKSKAKRGHWGLLKVKSGIKVDQEQQPPRAQGNSLAFSALSNPKAVHRAKLKLEREVKQLKQDYQKRTRLFLAMLPKEKAQELMAAGVFSKENVKEDTLDQENELVVRLEHQLDSLRKSQQFWQNRLQNHIEAMQFESPLGPTIEEEPLVDGTGTLETKREQADAKQARTALDVMMDQQSQHADGRGNTARVSLSTNQSKGKAILAGMLANLASGNKPDSSIGKLVIAGAKNNLISGVKNNVDAVAKNVLTNGVRNNLIAFDAGEERESSSIAEPAMSPLNRLKAFARVKRGMHMMKFAGLIAGGASPAGGRPVHPQDMRRFQLLLPVWRKAATSVRFIVGEVQREMDASREAHQEHSSSIKKSVLEIQRKAKLESRTCDEQLSFVLSLVPDKRSRFLIVQHLINLLDMPLYDQKPSMRCLSLGHITNEDPLRRNARKDENDGNKIDSDSMRCLAVASLLGQRLCTLLEKQWGFVESNKLLQMVVDALEQDFQDRVQPEELLGASKRAEAFFQSVNLKARLAAAEARNSVASSLDSEVLKGLQDKTNSNASAMTRPSAGQKGLPHKGAQSVVARKRRASNMNQLVKEPVEQTGTAVDSQRLPIIPPRRRRPSAELDGYSSSATSLGSSEAEEHNMQGGRSENQRPSSGNVLSPRKNLVKSAAKEAKHAFNRRASVIVGIPMEQYWSDMREMVKSRRAELYEEQMQKRRAEQNSWDEQDESTVTSTFSSNNQIRALQLRGDGRSSKDSPIRAKPPQFWFDRRTFMSNGSSLSPHSPRSMKSLLNGAADEDEGHCEDDHAQRVAEVRRKFFLDDDFAQQDAKAKGPVGSPREAEDALDKPAESVASENIAKASKRKKHDDKNDSHDLAIGAVQRSATEPPQESDVSVNGGADFIRPLRRLELDSWVSAGDPKFKRRISALHGVHREGPNIQSSLEGADSLEEQEGSLPPAGMFAQALLKPSIKQKNNNPARRRPMSAPMARQQNEESPRTQDFVVSGATIAEVKRKMYKRSRRQLGAQRQMFLVGFQSSSCSRPRDYSPMSLPALSSDNDSSSDDEDAYETFLKEILEIRQLLAGSGVPEPRSVQSKAGTTGAALAVAIGTAACKFSPPEGWHPVLDGSAPRNAILMGEKKCSQRFTTPLAQERGNEERKRHEQPAQVGEALRQQQPSPTPAPASEISIGKREGLVTVGNTENRHRVTSPKLRAQAGTVMQPQEKRKKPNLLNIHELSQMSLADAQNRLHESLMLFNRSRLAESTSTMPDAWSAANDVAWKPQAPASFMPSLKIPPAPQQQVTVQKSSLRAADSHSPVVTAACTSPQLQHLEAPFSATPLVLLSPHAPVAGAADFQALAEDGTLQRESSTELFSLRDESSITAGPSEQVSARAKALLQYMEGFDTFALDRLLSSRPGTGARSQLSTPRTPRRAAQSSRPRLPSVFPKLPSPSATAQTQQIQASVPAEAKASTWGDGHLPKILESTKLERSQPEKARKHGLGLLGENRQLTSQAADWSDYLEQRLGSHLRSTAPGASMHPTRSRQRSNRAREQQLLQ